MKETIVKKTYGVYGLMEWHVLIPAAGSKVRITFGGGQASGFGCAPATYDTADPGMQRLIESTRWFREGVIVTLRSEILKQ